jgi:putative membrane protein
MDVSTRLAVDRTLLAHDRNIMSWIRTAASLITFGFAIDRFFEMEHAEHTWKAHLMGPRQFAILLIATGLIALLLATWEHWRSLKEMNRLYGDIPRRTTAGVVAGLIALLGIAALLVSLRQM